MTRNRNLFSIGRRRHDEDQLTEMLAWLAQAVPAVAPAMASLADIETTTESVDWEVSTQVWLPGGRLDLLVTSPNAVVVVESKLLSDYGLDQLYKYLEWIASAHPRKTAVLMTLTRDQAPWDERDLHHALQLGVAAAPRRWEQLHELLDPLTAGDAEAEVHGSLVKQFLDMLEEEGLIPMQPLTEAELGDAWSNARPTIVRFHEFFRASKSGIADALGGRAVSNSSSEHWEYAWQDYKLPNEAKLVVGLYYTDVGIPLADPGYRNAPVVWMAALGDGWTDWADVANALETTCPEGWLPRKKRWWGRPEIWCYLSDATGRGTFDEQCARFIARISAGARWVADARAAVPTQESTGSES